MDLFIIALIIFEIQSEKHNTGFLSIVSTGIVSDNSSLSFNKVWKKSEKDDKYVSTLISSQLQMVACHIDISSKKSQNLLTCDKSNVDLINITIKATDSILEYHSIISSVNARQLTVPVNSFSLSSSTFNSISFLSHSFEKSSSVISCNVHRCLFLNLSVPHIKANWKPLLKGHLSCFSSTSFISIDHLPCYSLIPFFISCSSSCKSENTTYLFCNRRAINNTEYIGENGRQTPTTNAVFNCDAFTNCSSASNGGAIYAGNKCNLDAIKCIFKNCSAEKLGGAVYHESECQTNIINCTYQNCSSRIQDGAISLWFGTTTIVVNSQFMNCSVVDNYFGALNMERMNENSFLAECNFSRCTSKSYGGSIGVPYPPNNYRIFNCIFENNYAGYRGGAIYLWSPISTTSLKFRFLMFLNNKAGEDGNDVACNSTFFSYVNSSSFQLCFSTSEQPRFVRCPISGSCNSSYNEPDWIPDMSPVELHVNLNSGLDTLICGVEGEECKSIHYAISHITFLRSLNVFVSEETYMTDCLFVNHRTISIYAQEVFETSYSTPSISNAEIKAPSIITNITLPSWCHIENGNFSIHSLNILFDINPEKKFSLFEVMQDSCLSLNKLWIKYASDLSKPLQQSIFIIQNGIVSFQSVEIKSFFSLYPLFKLAEFNHLNFSGLALDSITRVSGSGTVIEASLSFSQQLTIENVSHVNCSCMNGNGGCISIMLNNRSFLRIGNISDDSKKVTFCKCSAFDNSSSDFGGGGALHLMLEEPETEFEISNVVFKGNDAVHGKNVFISSPHLELIPKERYEFVSLLSEDVHDAEGAGDTNNATLVIPIVCYLLDVPRSEIYVSASGADHPQCGHTFFECRTLNCPIEREENTSADGTEVRMKAGNGVEVGSTVIFSKMARVIEGTGDDGSLVVKCEVACNGDEEGCNGVFVALKETTMRKIELVIPSVLEHHEAIFQLKGETLNLSECIVTFEVGVGVSYVGYSFIVVEKGEANVTSLRFDSVRFGKAGIRANGRLSSVSLKNVELNDITFEGEKGFIVCEEGSILTSERVIASGCNMGGSSMICVESNCIAKMRECSWSSCNFENSGVIRGLDAKEVSIWRCNGSSILVKDGDGGMVRGTVGEGGIVDVRNTSVEGCVAGRGNGGGMCIAAVENALLNVNGGLMKECNAEEASVGKGGWLYANCSERRGWIPFKFEGVKFAGNEAFVGKNMFILDKDLNVTVRNETFAIHVEGMEDDQNLFVGSDEKRISTDLLRFIIEYRSERIVVWENGDDVVRCGSEEDPCETLEMGLKHIERGEGRKVVGVKEKIRVEGEHDLSGIDVESVGAGCDEMEYGTVVMGSEGESGTKVCIRNSGMIILRALEMCVMNVLGSGEAGMIVSEGEKIEWEDCSISWKGKREGMGNVVFCVVKKGELEMKRFKLLSYFGKRGVFAVSGEVVSVIDEFTVIEAKLESGGLFEIEGEGANGEGEMRMKNCSIGSVEGEGVDPSVILSKSGSGVTLVVEDSLIEGCSCGRSTKGGAILFELNEGGLFDVVNTSVKQCGCSVSVGKGGGVYLKTELRGELDYVFDGVIFRRNTASIGNDVFIMCDCIERQINETQFNIDFRDKEFIEQNAIYGMDAGEHKEKAIDLMTLIVKYQSDTIVISSKEGKGGRNEQQCGKPSLPCATIGFGLRHLTHDFFSQVFVDEESVIDEEIGLETLTLSGIHEAQSRVIVKGRMNCSKEMIVETNEQVHVRWIQFSFEEVETTQTPLPTTHSSFMKISSGKTSISMCSFEGVSSVEREMVEVPFCLIYVERGKCSMGNVSVMWLSFLSETVMQIEGDTDVSGLTLRNIEGRKGYLKISGAGNSRVENGWMESVNGDEAEMKNREDNEFSILILSSSFENITCVDESAGVVDVEEMEGNVEFSNCSFVGCESRRKKGKMISLLMCKNIQMKQCLFDGKINEKQSNEEVDVCKWNGSVVEMKESSGYIKDMSFVNCSDGGLSIWGGSLKIEDGKFENNNPSIEKYPSIRRNILCSDSGMVNVVNLKGGDGLKDNTSLWILDEGCTLEGIAGERPSALFIPVLESAEMGRGGEKISLSVRGKLLVPCNLSVRVCFRDGSEEHIEGHEIEEDGYVGENEIQTAILSAQLAAVGAETEVSVCILFGRKDAPSSTGAFILKNRSEIQGNSDERIAEGGKEGKSLWPIIVIIMAIILMIVIIASVVVTIRWRKQKRRTEELEEIVNDNIRKDPKAFEMVTMEMSPEEQWRRVSGDVEKKNDERIKKRVYEKSLGHSESSEHLLSECGSTEYILGRDSDKIPEWVLEKVEEEEIRKRTPSPSISSTSTIDTSDTESTFVRGEDLCPTTSSMSNLVDAMACSSPHEKLIVDLRDSLFMLLHGRNEKKEMAIGTLKEREMTAAQILFWVANGALHAFEDEEDGLPSLANLSPHIVLFSEHMVICIALHSDCSSDDSDSSSISSLTIVSSSSNISVLSERFTDSPPPSSAFEDEDSFKKECLRWKAPELQMNKKLEATEKSVAFSIGMMLWECLTLTIPFGEYEAVIAGDKIANGERPDLRRLEGNSYENVARASLSGAAGERPTLSELRREFVGHFGGKAAMVTMSDAIELCGSGEGDESATKSGTNSGTKSGTKSGESSKRSGRRGRTKKWQNEEVAE